jgi:hypothetical protein
VKEDGFLRGNSAKMRELVLRPRQFPVWYKSKQRAENQSRTEENKELIKLHIAAGRAEQ